jgi:hypothetical protein
MLPGAAGGITLLADLLGAPPQGILDHERKQAEAAAAAVAAAAAAAAAAEARQASPLAMMPGGISRSVSRANLASAAGQLGGTSMAMRSPAASTSGQVGSTSMAVRSPVVQVQQGAAGAAGGSTGGKSRQQVVELLEGGQLEDGLALLRQQQQGSSRAGISSSVSR